MKYITGPSGQTYKVSRGGRGGKRKISAFAKKAICPRCDRELTQRPGDDGGYFPHKCG